MKSSVRWMAQNHVAANLLMMVLIVGGLIMAFNLKQEVFPEISLDVINVTIVYPGAGPEEIEEGIVLKVEEALSSLDGIKEIRSTAVEGVGAVSVEILSGMDADVMLQDVKSEVDRIDTFPEEAEKPQITKVIQKTEVISVVVYGDAPERSLVETAEAIRDDLLARPEITQLEITGTRPYEISIEVSEHNLRRFGITLGQIADRVRLASLDLPAGSIKTEGGEVLVRTKERRYVGTEYEDITILHNPDGTEVKLGEIAAVRDTFEETDVASFLNGKPAAMVKVYRVGDQKPIEISNVVKAYIEEKAPSLPSSMGIEVGYDSTKILRGRQQLLLKNAFYGLILVFMVLGMFLRVRLSLWVMLGIPISFLGAMLMMPALDVSINMISLFAFILVLGIVVDDAIVVGENIYEHRLKGKPYMQAAVDGALEVSGPVVFSILTTIAAFMPLLFISGVMGKFIKVIPYIVIPVLIISLVECLYILPSHLSFGSASNSRETFFTRFRARFNALVDGFIAGPYDRFLSLCLRNRYSTIAASVAVLLVFFGLVGGGIVQFRFMPEVEGDQVITNLRMPVGTTIEETNRVQGIIVDGGLKVIKELDDSDLGYPVLRNIFSLTGTSLFGAHSLTDASSGSNMAGIIMFLTNSEDREILASEIERKWRNTVGEIPGVDSLTYTVSIVGFGANIDVALAHQDFGVLEVASDRVKAALAEYPGVSDIEDTYTSGKKELKIRLKPEARTLGVTEADLARQIRSAFYGAEALRLQRGRNEVKVMVRYPEEYRKSLSDLEDMFIHTPGGGMVPLKVAATVEEGRGFSVINRTERKRVTNVTAKVDDKVASAEGIIADIKAGTLKQLVSDYPGLTYDLEGEDAERRESMVSMAKGFLFALLLIFVLLAIPFRSYSQPLLIMAAIPFGMVGAVMGHMIMGYKLSILSVFGIVALAGVVVNDSLLLIDYINRRRERGYGLFDAVRQGGRRRFRPIILTSLTTFFGLMPMILETSVQARFLIPMAISLGFGILFATVITLIMIPSLYIILEDLKGAVGMGRPEDIKKHRLESRA